MIKLESFKWDGKKDMTEQQFIDAYGKDVYDQVRTGKGVFETKSGNIVKATATYKFHVLYESDVYASNLEEAKKLAEQDLALNGLKNLKIEQIEFEK